MKVERRTETELELREAPTLVMLIAGVFGIGGTFVLMREGEVLIAGGFFLLVLALAAVLATSTTCRFDRAAGALACTRRNVFGTKHARHPLAEITGVHTERSAAQRSQAYRIVLDMSTGASVPLTSQFTSGRAGHESTARVIREFLGLPQPVDVKIPGFGDLFRMAISGGGADAIGGMQADAIAHHEARIRVAPDDVDARRQLGMALAMSGKPAEARGHLQHARDVAVRDGNDRIASQLDEAIRRLDTATSAR